MGFSITPGNVDIPGGFVGVLIRCPRRVEIEPNQLDSQIKQYFYSYLLSSMFLPEHRTVRLSRMRGNDGPDGLDTASNKWCEPTCSRRHFCECAVGGRFESTRAPSPRQRSPEIRRPPLSRSIRIPSIYVLARPHWLASACDWRPAERAVARNDPAGVSVHPWSLMARSRSRAYRPRRSGWRCQTPR